MGIKAQLLVVAKVWVCVLIGLFVIAMVTGNFSINNSNHTKWFGVYNGVVKAPARYNTGYETVMTLEMVSLLLLPLVLLALRQLAWPKVKLIVAPWMLMSVSALFATFVWPLGLTAHRRAIDPFTQSTLPDLLLFQVPIIAALVCVAHLLTNKVSRTDKQVS